MADRESIPVVIIGAGPVGLCSSIMLSLRRIPHVLFERHPGTSIHPKACGINQRTTEIFRSLGVYDEVRRCAAPDDIKGRTGWFTSLGGRDEDANGIDGQEIWSRDAWGGGQYEAEYEKHSPARYEVLPQIRLEPILVRRAKEVALSPDTLRFRCEVTSLDAKGDDGVLVKVQTPDKETEVRARYVIAADGGRSITDKLGVSWLGEKDIMDMVSVHFRSPIRQHHPDSRNFITWFSHPERGGSIGTGYLYQIGPWPFESPKAGATRNAMIARLRNTLKIPELPIEVVSLSHWHVHAISAEKYRVGRVFLVGDAAHRIPPWGALGMNTGIQDAQNLVWKLGLAIVAEAQGSPGKYESLLDSYDDERRPVGRRVGLSSLHNLRSHGLIMDAALGMSPNNTTEENRAALRPFLDKSHPGHAAKVAAVERAQKVLDLEFKAPGAEVGWFYPSVDVQGQGEASRHGDQLTTEGQMEMEHFFPSTIPGHNLPHVWMTRNDGERTALRDLLLLDRFLLLGNDPKWGQLVHELVHIEILGRDGWTAETGDWVEYLDGYDAILVRPDGIIAWRGRWRESLVTSWYTTVGSCLGLGSTTIMPAHGRD